MLAACRNDQDEMLEDIFKEGDFDINHTDALGDSALHYAYGNINIDF
jgi:ankyrin repeat protein